MDRDIIECDRVIFSGRWVYQVRVESELEESGFNTTFTAVLDPWTGELVETRRSV